MTIMKLRAECLADVVRLTQKIGFNQGKVTTFEGRPDVEFEFVTNLGLETILRLIAQIEDGHVMYETIQPIQDYTGDRGQRSVS